jgi:hypothetical protein
MDGERMEKSMPLERIKRGKNGMEVDEGGRKDGRKDGRGREESEREGEGGWREERWEMRWRRERRWGKGREQLDDERKKKSSILVMKGELYMMC